MNGAISGFSCGKYAAQAQQNFAAFHPRNLLVGDDQDIKGQTVRERSARSSIAKAPHRSRLRALAYVFILPFLFFATISPGTMLEAGPTGVRIVICTGDGMVEAVMTPGGEVHRLDDLAPSHDPKPAPCDWAMHGQPGVADAQPITAAAPLMELRANYIVNIPLHARRVDVLTPAARGPPAII